MRPCSFTASLEDAFCLAGMFLPVMSGVKKHQRRMYVIHASILQQNRALGVTVHMARHDACRQRIQVSGLMFGDM